MSDLLKEMHQVHDALAARRDKAHQHWQEVVAQSRQLEEAIGKMQRQLNSHRERRYQTELQIKELEKPSRPRSKPGSSANKSGDIEAMGPAEIAEDFSREETQRRIDKLRQSIQRMGPVHVGVLSEYEQEKEHYDFQIQQRDDLLAAAEDLKKTLSLIDRRARKLFGDTFDQIRQQFKKTFARFC